MGRPRHPQEANLLAIPAHVSSQRNWLGAGGTRIFRTDVALADCHKGIPSPPSSFFLAARPHHRQGQHQQRTGGQTSPRKVHAESDRGPRHTFRLSLRPNSPDDPRPCPPGFVNHPSPGDSLPTGVGNGFHSPPSLKTPLPCPLIRLPGAMTWRKRQQNFKSGQEVARQTFFTSHLIGATP